MKPKRIVIIRHGESVGNVDRSIHATVPDWKIALTPKGDEQAIHAGKELTHHFLKSSLSNSVDIGVYLSPYKRTRETWNGIKQGIEEKLNVMFEKEDPRLREQEWGNLRSYEPRRWEDIEREREEYGSLFYRFLHGESGLDVYDRCSGFLDTLYRDFEKENFPKNVLIVTHGYTLRVLIMRWLHIPIEDFHDMRNPKNAEFTELIQNAAGKYELVKPFPRYSEGAPRIPYYSAVNRP